MDAWLVRSCCRFYCVAWCRGGLYQPIHRASDSAPVVSPHARTINQIVAPDVNGSRCGRVAAGVGAFAPLVGKARLAASTLGSGVTQYSGLGFKPAAWGVAQAICNVRRHAFEHAREFFLSLQRGTVYGQFSRDSIRNTTASCTQHIAGWVSGM